jgi:hypothetical protein
MKISIQAAFLAGAVVSLAVLAPNASCQDGLHRVDAQPGHLQAVPESPGDAQEAALDSYQSCDSGCNPQDACACTSGGRPRALIGRSRGCSGTQGGFARLGSAVHSGQPLVDPWARADWIASQRAMTQSWHGGYSHTGWGAPVALIVPPTARMQTRMGWGVSQTMMSPIYHQFERPYPSAPSAGGMAMPGPSLPLQPTPRWPSHTDQFGVYYVRGPW